MVASGHSHFTTAWIAGLCLCIAGVALASNVGGLGGRLVQAGRKGRTRPHLGDAFYFVGWGLILVVVGVAWMLIGFGVLS
jgi:hypothetical protein